MEDKSKIPILKVGDKIRIKSKEWFDSQDKTVYGSINPPNGQALYFRPLMSIHCGEICTIKEITSHSTNTVKVNENNYNWGSWMFDIVESAHEYKVGDKVRIKSKEWFDSQPKDKDGDIITPEGYLLYFFRSMQVYCGKVYTIESISTNDHLINFKEDNRSWESWMFDPVEEEENSTVSDEEECSIGDIIQLPSNSRYIIIDIAPKSKFYTTVEMSSGEIHYIDKTKSHTFAGKYLSDIDTKLDIKDRATLVRKSLNTIIEIGDVIKDKEGDHFIIIGYNSKERIYDVVDSHWDCNRIYRTKDLTMVEKGKYKDLIDTNLSGEAIARSLRNREGVIRMSESIREADNMPVPKPYSIGDAFLGPHRHVVTIIALSKEIGVNKDYLLVVDTVSGDVAWVPAKVIGKITLPNKYTNVINIHEYNTDKRLEEFIKYLNIQKEPTKISAKTDDIISGFREATKEEPEQLRVAHLERWAKLIEVSFISKDNNSQSNFNKFDLSKVIYKFRIIK